ncbi:Cell wall biosynthesis protein LcpA [Nocardia sp. RB20]|uniref:Cell wall biosynthesis protein LcpA n=1 Tax=Nocardia macrotermitis TaxID=2585198 RepID=A0A7K0D2N5_9NOCA|nr:Cell wall biosynthesis protein LcpA [Nocardia macrotermitis]
MPQQLSSARPGRSPRRRPGRLLVAALAALIFVVTGFGWHSIDGLISGIERIGDLGLGGGSDGATDILMVGIDSRTDAHGNPLSSAERAMLHAGDEVGTNTDTIILIRIPNNGRSATAISIPRDSYVDIPGIGKGKINSAYGSTKELARQKLAAKGVSDAEADKQSTQAGREALIKTVAELTGITVDHYAEVGLLGFVLLTDAVGGVQVCLNNAVDEPMSGADFPAGVQRLNGAQALSFVRQRHELPRGDLDRIVRQQVYMASLVHQALSAQILANPTKLDALSKAVGRTIVLDDKWNVIDFMKQLQDLTGGQVRFETIPVADLNGTTDDGESVVRVDTSAVRTYVASLVGRSGSGGVTPAQVTADVYNASDTSGLAGQVAQALTGKGFRTGTVDNWAGAPVSTSRVLAAKTTDAKAAAVAKALGGLPVLAVPGMAEGAVRVVLAGDYSGPGSAAGELFDTSGSSTTATPVPPAAPIDAGQNGPKCVN